ncbi:hypothetical protein [Vibrio sp. 10N.261.55.A7]|uniref:hypothetical protein n=1 Tax=Vibrio sp. 10N.261.55.A7 TaxID=1880851 RepID=UPI000C866FF2|nr:hypothetical protein [Vibrio sp. 10N.261.55.A7]PMJ98756.1 hypothetical protein BCU12_21660 [Vibrio sp. 10N.261.55.A7]
MNNQHKGIWFAYVASLFTPLTCLLSGVIAIVYAGYRLDKGEDSEIVNSHYYGLIRSFFLNLTFFVVLIITIATTNGVLKGINDYWYNSTMIDNVAYGIPIVGMIFATVAIIVWFIRMFRGMKQLKANLPHPSVKGPNL